jgi:ferredoxin
MKFDVDHDLCIGCGACGNSCPKVFNVYDDKSHVILDPVPEELQEDALTAEEGCPVGAISHE